ncbi:glyoxalase/bleomycin resistance protein/dioxygenase [Psychromonas sp. CNPT3]|uniref:VOC family protein n=1 Tax=Psychromonas sp. CNPT3 TaxID=314282 RepID=UPI00006E7661|nr:VOC family protein [Psychromonas sp. CNPT3]AGH80329.1 glyoxalase/bleomycin resistance protein/dioxygenase [Psychromonas sp. CNPT3]
MKLGAFSISLSVKNLQKSKSFYERLDFKVIGGDADKHWLIMRNGKHTIGLFNAMFEKNVMTFNPGWDEDCTPLDDFVDIRELQKTLKSRAIKFETEVDENSTGPADFIIIDPDGNPILIDQHVDKLR